MEERQKFEAVCCVSSKLSCFIFVPLFMFFLHNMYVNTVHELEWQRVCTALSSIVMTSCVGSTWSFSFHGDVATCMHSLTVCSNLLCMYVYLNIGEVCELVIGIGQDVLVLPYI